MGFDALTVSLELIRTLAPIVKKIRTHDTEEANQMQSAASSIARNIAEGSARAGKDRPHLYRVAAGSNREVRAGLLIACAWGWVTQDEVADALQLSDRQGAILWRLTH